MKIVSMGAFVAWREGGRKLRKKQGKMNGREENNNGDNSGCGVCQRDIVKEKIE